MLHSVHLERAAELLRLARSRRILVVGDAMLDMYLTGDADRISPEAPVPVVRVSSRHEALGGAANVAQNVIALGAECDIACALGADAAGQRMRAQLAAMGIGTRSIVTAARPTTQKTRIIARSQQLVRVDEEVDTDLSTEEAASLIGAIQWAVTRADALVLEDYNKGVLRADVIDAATQCARAKGIPVIVDPKYRNFFAYGGATIFKPNIRELTAALGAALPHDARDMRPIVERLGVEYLLLTLGERGMALYARSGDLLSIPTAAREVYDVVGAGDTVSAYLAAILAAGGTPMEAAILANAAAGVEVGKAGASTVSADELLAELAREDDDVSIRARRYDEHTAHNS